MGYHVRVKICGVTAPDDARTIASAGADAVGLNFYRRSPRYVEEPVAAAILAALPPFVSPVGVFGDTPPGEIVALARRLTRLSLVQVHGNRPLPAEVGHLPLIVAVGVEGVASLGELDDYLARCLAAGSLPVAVLVDARVPGLLGGTGRRAPWHLLTDYRPPVPLILAGGLTPENVAEAVRAVRPYAVDVASGVESTPGRKDPDKVQRFIDNARSAAAGLPGLASA